MPFSKYTALGKPLDICLPHFLAWKMEKAIELPPGAVVRTVSIYENVKNSGKENPAPQLPRSPLSLRVSLQMKPLMQLSFAVLCTPRYMEWKFRPQGKGWVAAERGLPDPGQWAAVQGKAPSLVRTWQVGHKRMPELSSKGGAWERVTACGRLPPGLGMGTRESPFQATYQLYRLQGQLQALGDDGLTGFALLSGLTWKWAKPFPIDEGQLCTKCEGCWKLHRKKKHSPDIRQMQKGWVYCLPLSYEWLFKLWELSAINGLVFNIRKWSGMLAIITAIIKAACLLLGRWLWWCWWQWGWMKWWTWW